MLSFKPKKVYILNLLIDIHVHKRASALTIINVCQLDLLRLTCISLYDTFPTHSKLIFLDHPVSFCGISLYLNQGCGSIFRKWSDLDLDPYHKTGRIRFNVQIQNPSDIKLCLRYLLIKFITVSQFY